MTTTKELTNKIQHAGSIMELAEIFAAVEEAYRSGEITAEDYDVCEQWMQIRAGLLIQIISGSLKDPEFTNYILKG